MNEMVAFCGLGCHECGAFLATKENDDQKRSEVAKEWSRLYKVEIKPEDRRLFNYCNVCEIRKCGKEKGVMNCGYCGEYPCHKLDFIFGNAPDAKKRLDKINFSFK